MFICHQKRHAMQTASLTTCKFPIIQDIVCSFHILHYVVYFSHSYSPPTVLRRLFSNRLQAVVPLKPLEYFPTNRCLLC